MRKSTFPKAVTVKGVAGISATIYRQKQRKSEAEYISYTLAYSLLGKLRREAFADLTEAEDAGKEAIKRIANGQQGVLELNNRDRDAYLRSKELLAPLNVDIETACRDYAEARAILKGTGGLSKAAMSSATIIIKGIKRNLCFFTGIRLSFQR